MSTLKALLKDVPVEWKSLFITCEIKTGKGITKNDSCISAKYPIISGGKEPMGYYKEFNRDERTVTISRVGANAGFVNFIKTKFYLNDKCFSIIPNEDYKNIIDEEYLFYVLKVKESDIIELQSQGGVPTINTTKVGNLQIPIPYPNDPEKSLAIQQEIVRVLDGLSEQNKALTTALAQEIDQRKKQYEYYREELFRFEGKEVEWKELKSVFNIRRGKRLIKSDLLPSGKYAVFQNSMTPLGYYEEFNVKSDTTFIISAGSAGEIGYSNIDFWAADDVYFFEKLDNILSKFLYYFLLNKKTHLSKQVRRSSVPRLSKTSFEKYLIPVPSIQEQERIVHLLDQFDEATKNIVAQLEKEIELRNKQYEYYRNLLLSFPN